MIPKSNRILAFVPLSLPLYLYGRLVYQSSPFLSSFVSTNESLTRTSATTTTTAAQLAAYLILAAAGYSVTRQLVPHIQQYTLRKGICGKDLGKRGTALADRPVYVFCSFAVP
jgi:hypothetical protein